MGIYPVLRGHHCATGDKEIFRFFKDRGHATQEDLAGCRVLGYRDAYLAKPKWRRGSGESILCGHEVKCQARLRDLKDGRSGIVNPAHLQRTQGLLIFSPSGAIRGQHS